MKKLLFTTNFINNGGPSRVLLNQIEAIDKKKYEIYVLTIIQENDNNLVKELKEKGIQVIEFEMKKSIFDLFKFYKQIINIIADLKPNIIHTHGIVTSIIVASSSIRCYKITTVHNSIFDDYMFKYGKILGILIAKFHIMRLRKFNDIVCCSETALKDNIKYLKKATYIRNGIDFIDDDFYENKKNIRKRVRNNLNIPNDAKVYIYCGVLTNRKNVTSLVNNFNHSLKEDEYLIIIGDGPQKKEVYDTIKSNKIIMLGYKNNVSEYYLASDIYTSYSLSEGFSISVIEALSCGLSILVYDIPSHRECFEIDESYYIGELFGNDNFLEKKLNVYGNIYKNESVFIYKKYLSATAMMNEYEKYYEKA